jgi:inner membrane protein
LYIPVIAGMATTVFLGLLTDDGIAPLAPLWDGRFGFRIMYTFDALVMGLSVLTLALGFVFFPFRRYMARMGLVCIALYMLSNAGLAWQARSFGWDYAEAQEIAEKDDVRVHALPQPLSPLNWRVLVVQDGKMHDTLINLKRTAVVKLPPNPTRAARVDALYRPRALAVWRVYDRFGKPGEEDEADRLRVERAYAAWMDTPFDWYGRYAIFSKLMPSPLEGFAATCVTFVDIRFEGARQEAKGTYLICPAGRNGKARVFQPRGKEEWKEIVPIVGVGNV